MKKLFFQSRLKTQLKRKFKNLRPHFQNSFVPTIFYVFCVRLQNGTQTSYWKQNSSVILSTSWILQIIIIFFYIYFWAFLLLCCLVSNIFTMFFRDSEVCLERCDSYDDFGYIIKKSNIFIWREICKRTRCPSIVTLVLLLFLC